MEDLDPPPVDFTWKIFNFTSLSAEKIYSPVFTAGDYKWRIQMFPRGNNVKGLSLFLDVAYSETLPHKWCKCATFSLTVVNQIDSTYSIERGTKHMFNARESEWGYLFFMPLDELYEPSMGYLVNDTVVIEAEIRLNNEQKEEEERREKVLANLYTLVKVARDEDLAEQIGRDFHFDLVDHDKVQGFFIPKKHPFFAFKEVVAKEFGIPVQFQRFWFWTTRQNFTYRLHRPLTPEEESQTVGQLVNVPREFHLRLGDYSELRLFLEADFGLDLRPIPLPDKTNEDILLFFKLYEPEKQELRFVGRLFVKLDSEPIEILSKLNQIVGFSPEEEIELYEEVKFGPSVIGDHIDKRTSFRLSQFQDGDIICFQKSTTHEFNQDYKYFDVPSFLEYVRFRRIVHFRSLDKPTEDDFILELSRLDTYDDVVKKVAGKIGLEDPTKIRLTAHSCYSQQPKSLPINYRGVEQLKYMLIHYYLVCDILYYEVLDIPLPEVQALKSLKVDFHHATRDEVRIHNIRLPKHSTVGNVINILKRKVQLSHPNAEIRLLQVYYHKIYRVIPCSEKIDNINERCWTLHAEEIPEEEKNLGPHDCLIQVYHFTKETAEDQLMQVNNFGEPFFLIIREGETLAEVKVHLQRKLQVPENEFLEWKFLFVSFGFIEYLHDSDVVSSRLQRRDVYGRAWEQCLGLEHSENATKRAQLSGAGKELGQHEDINARMGVAVQKCQKRRYLGHHDAELDAGTGPS
ncbi:ubiquitin C-terminal hydrolase 12-like [Pyrus x bretschneideri]|uniref:ubiquitin C-terminal hydrolase 12-like n=1 Tax=Pyrus x bretschneideri TaxID=225117 RepID=UPI002030DADA|nr:ubiquitin C-terminal hydrolase 12-like [Pyrus x bretschneideri]